MSTYYVKLLEKRLREGVRLESMYLIVVGAGDIGSQVIDLATEAGVDTVVIEKDPERAEKMSRDYDCLVIEGDASDKSVLEDAGADEADAVICTTESDATNMMVLLLSEEIGIPQRVTVVQNPEHLNLFRRVGANILENPQHLIADYLFRAVQRPSVEDFMHVGETAEIFEIPVGADSDLVGMTIAEAGDEGYLDEGVLIVAVDRDGDVIIPKGQTRIQKDDLVTVFSREGMTEDVLSIFE